MSGVDAGSQWDAIAGLRLKLRPHISTHRHVYRGQTWYVLHNSLAPASYRFDATSMEFIAALDGKRPVAAIHQDLVTARPDWPLGQEDIVSLLAQLHAVDMLHGDIVSSTQELEARRHQVGGGKWMRRLLSPTAIRIPLIDPDLLLVRHVHRFRLLFTPAAVVLWGLIVLVALLSAFAQWPGLLNHGVTRGTDPQNLLLLALIFPVIKLLHESAHAVATRFWGGEVHEAGLMLLVFVPVPYVEASASTVFENKWRRIAVSASGLMVETLLAALALFIWINVQPGLVRDIAFNVMVIGGLATLLFNGNPLLRFDGYYILADLVEIPNLGSRSQRYLAYLAKRYLLRLADEKRPVLASGEPAWFVGYGLSSFVYRIYISLVIALFIAERFFMLGTLLALWVIGSQLVLPVLRLLRYLLLDTALLGRRGNTLLAVSAVLLAFVLVGGVVPVPAWTTAEGVVSMPQQAQVRAATSGFVEGVSVRNGQVVAAGDALFETSNAELPVQLAVSRGRLAELESRKTLQLITDRSRSGIIDEQIAHVRAEIDQLEKQQAMLLVKSPKTGRFKAAHDPDLQGRYLREGELLGYVATGAELQVRVVVPQTAIELVREITQSVEARFASLPGQLLRGRVLQEVPAVGRKLPSLALGAAGGGRIAVDARDPEGLTAAQSIYFVDIALPFHENGDYIGSKVYIRFNHRPEPFLRQWWRSLRQLFLARLEI